MAAAGAPAAANVYQGIVSNNSVTFYGIPILPASSNGTRIFRMTNLRVNANGFTGSGPIPNVINGAVSVSPQNAFTLDPSVLIVAFVARGLEASIRESTAMRNGDPSKFGQQGNSMTGILRFAENFPGAFKTRSALINGNTNPAGVFIGQNIPGEVYQSESGFTFAAAAG